MKNIYILLGILFISFGFNACNEILDKELPPHQISASEAVVDEATAETAMMGVYSNLGNFGDYAANYLVDCYLRMNFMDGQNRSNYDIELKLFCPKEDDSNVKNRWKSYYESINSVNNFIYYINLASDNKFGGDTKIQYEAEAKFMRAFTQSLVLKTFCYFWDTESEYGPVMRRKPSCLANANYPRDSVKTAYKYIFEDLDFAIENAPDYHSCFRASKGAAKALKTEMLMLRGSEGDYAQALQLADQVINDYNFELEDTFEDVFENDYQSSEMIFSRHLGKQKLDDVDGNLASLKKYYGGVYKATDTIVHIIDTVDARYSLTFDTLMYEEVTDDRESPIIKKIWREDGNCPMIYFRLAEMYLIKAECLWRTNASIEDCIAPINILRLRSGNTEYKVEDFGDRQEVIEMIFNEIVREIGLENGFDWFASLRIKDREGEPLLKRFNANYIGWHQVPIPISFDELKYNNRIIQNPLPE